ncbi:hypothetical protein FRC07_008503 [Ceratobasidium sp. 392]|nr:hypothetical protein FRC07_008503 [Ceratobasidium sp. 392]
MDTIRSQLTLGPLNIGGGAGASNVEQDIEKGDVSSEVMEPEVPKNGRFRMISKRAINMLQITRPSRPANGTAQPIDSGPQAQLSLSERRPQLARIQCLTNTHQSQRLNQVPSEHDLGPNLTRIQGRVKMLRSLRSGQAFSEHMALIEHLQFSPGGQFLATCSWDEATLIWRIGSGPNELEVLHKLVNTSPVGQVAWCPRDGGWLLTKQQRAVSVWDTKVRITINTVLKTCLKMVAR